VRCFRREVRNRGEIALSAARSEMVGLFIFVSEIIHTLPDKQKH
jgi:hypothetical protein